LQKKNSKAQGKANNSVKITANDAPPVKSESAKKASTSHTDVIELSDTNDVETVENSNSEYWLKIGKFTSRAEDKDVLTSNQWLNDCHIACAQNPIEITVSSTGWFRIYNRLREIP